MANVIPRLEEMMNRQFPKPNSPMVLNYHPELDDSPLASNEMASKYRSMIGSLNWAITLGRFDIQYATGTMARYSMAPRDGHFKAVYRILGYLKHVAGLNPRLLVSPKPADHSRYPCDDHADAWETFYPGIKEDIPSNMPTPKGAPVTISIWVDADHAHDQITRKSISGVVVLINGMVYKTISKRQSTVESSTYGSELVASRIAVDLAIEIRYVLRMLGVKILGPTLLLGDNKSVILNSSTPSSVLKKKHCAINYHRVREAIAAQVVKFVH